MTEIRQRAFTGELEVRSGGDGRTLTGLAVPFNQSTFIRDWDGDYYESFVRGSFAKTIAERGDRVKLLDQHDRHSLLGRATLLREDANGLYAEFKVSKTARGDEILELARDGALDSFSIGFMPVQHTEEKRGTDVYVTRTEAGLREVSTVTFPAYDGAAIAGVRASENDIKLAISIANEMRAGNSVSAANQATLKHVLSLISNADRAVDEAQPILAELLGIPNPDVAQDAEDSRSDEATHAGLSAELLRAKWDLARLTR